MLHLCFSLLLFPLALLLPPVINDIYVSLYGQREGQPAIQVRVFGLTEMSRMRDLDPSHIDQLVCIKGMVIRSTHVVPDLKQAFFRCFVCAHTVDVLIDRGN